MNGVHTFAIVATWIIVAVIDAMVIMPWVYRDPFWFSVSTVIIVTLGLLVLLLVAFDTNSGYIDPYLHEVYHES